VRAIPSILVVGVAVAGLAGATYRFSPEWKTTLKPGEGSSITGTAKVEAKGDKATEAEINIKGAPAGAELPWHVHSGKCGTGGAVVGAATAYPVLKVKDNGEAKGEAKLDIATPTSGDYSVNVHKSAGEMKTIVACGDLALEQGKDKSKTAGY
jgi:hypothetical protein